MYVCIISHANTQTHTHYLQEMGSASAQSHATWSQWGGKTTEGVWLCSREGGRVTEIEEETETDIGSHNPALTKSRTNTYVSVITANRSIPPDCRKHVLGAAIGKARRGCAGKMSSRKQSHKNRETTEKKEMAHWHAVMGLGDALAREVSCWYPAAFRRSWRSGRKGIDWGRMMLSTMVERAKTSDLKKNKSKRKKEDHVSKSKESEKGCV